MKWDWSKILILAMVSFIILIVSMGIKMASTSSELYEEDYYQKGEDYQERIEETTRGEMVTINVLPSTQSVIIKANNKLKISTLDFRYLSDQKEDFSLQPVEVDKEITVPLPMLKSGVWILEAKGTIDGKNFFKKTQWVQ